jgi:hypothetical protein
MRPRSPLVAALAVILLGQLTVGIAAATDPSASAPPVVKTDGTSLEGGIYGYDGKTFVPLTADQLAAVEKKTQLAEQSLTTTARTPAPNGIDATCRNGTCGTILGTFYRHQDKNIYCGPAAVQVISNHAWGITSGNKYSQQTISNTWTHTDADGQTYVWRVRYGLNGATSGRYPWPYAEEYVSSGSVWHNYVVVDATDWGMPSAALVAPHDPGFDYYLTSWPTAVYAGHYIVTRGWLYLWDGTRTPTVYYNDGSAGYGGSNGQFSDPAYDIYKTIKKSHPNHSEGWIIW